MCTQDRWFYHYLRPIKVLRIFFFYIFIIFFHPKCTTFWKPNSKCYFQANVRTEHLGLFVHKGDAAGFRQILAPGPSLRKSVAVSISECRASWLMKPHGVAVVGSQYQKAPTSGVGVYGEGAGCPLLKLQWGPPQFAVHLCQL